MRMRVSLLLLAAAAVAAAAEAAPPSTLAGPTRPVTVPPRDRGHAVDLPDTDPRVQRRVKGWAPEQIAVALSAAPSSAWVSWVTGDFQMGAAVEPLDPTAVASVVRYGLAADSLVRRATGDALVYSQLYPFDGLLNYTSAIIHHVRLQGLEPGTEYFYQCGDPAIPAAMSDIHAFRTMPAVGPRSYPGKIAIVGDLGLTYNTTSTVEHMVSNQPDLVLLLGDVSYANLYLTNGTGTDCYSCSFANSTPIHETYQPRWDYWGRYMEPVTSRIPMMVVEGNHEIEEQIDNKTFASYSSRFSFPSTECGSFSPFYYSFDAGGIHFIMLAAYADYSKSGKQYKWLEKDLAKVDRSVTPWVIAGWHAPWYSTFKAHYREAECMRVAMEELLYSYAVDVVFTGHVHAYERSNRVFNYTLDPCGPVHISVGDGGNREKMATSYADEPGRCPDPLSTPDPFMGGGFCGFNFTSGPAAGSFCWDRQPDYSAYRESSFGHGILEVKNETHALWRWHRNQDLYGSVGDEIYIVREPDNLQPVQLGGGGRRRGGGGAGMVSLAAYSPCSTVAGVPKNKGNGAASSTHKESIMRHVVVQCATSWDTPRTSTTNGSHAEPSAVVKAGTAPLIQALKSTANQDVSCFHFPGHNRGKASPPSLSELIGSRTFLHDLPELPELDDLFSPKGVILDAQKRAAELFGSFKTWFLVNGSTCGIQASVMATCSPGDYLIIPRNCHISVISALVLSGAVPKYIVPEYNSGWDIAGGITPSQVDKVVKELEEDRKKVGAVLVTSPTYHGICSNIQGIVNVCHLQGIPVIVDEAHGAHFRFHRNFPSSATEQGADLVVQSTHKVLCSLTQSSMLHMAGDLVDADKVSQCLQLLQSSSPSYLLLSSLDAARAQLSENAESFDEPVSMALETKHQLRIIPGISVLDLSSFLSDFPAIDPLRITLSASDLQLSGYEADDFLAEEHQIVSELVGTQAVTFAVNLGTRRHDVQRLVHSVKHLSEKYFSENGSSSRKENPASSPLDKFSIKLTPREAFFLKKRRASIEDSLGEICGELICPYPPGIPVLIPGEIVTQDSLSYLMDVRDNGIAISGAADGELKSIMVCNV
uniref:Purple acid phosphatase n=2 Tax=Oryza rufipogon TaxID=4529 RepID=A0A0E0P3W8_ORYRU